MRYWLLIGALLFPAAVEACLGDCVPDDRLYRITRQYEGLRLFAYNDVAGYSSIGFGHLIKPGETFIQPITPEQAEIILEQDESDAVDDINQVVKVELKTNQFDALTDFIYNLGIGELERSTLLKLLNQGDMAAVPAQFILYDKARVNGVLTVLKGLFSRRTAEATLFRKSQ